MAALAELFSEAADLRQLEFAAIDVGHGCMVEALGLALEALDTRPFLQKPASLKTHDSRRRTFATEIGGVSFSIRRYRDRFGGDAYLLADALDVPYRCRVSPGATDCRAQGRAPRLAEIGPQIRFQVREVLPAR